MRYLFRLLCVCALGVMPLVGCSEKISVCNDLDVYECVDQPACTPAFGKTGSMEGYLTCLDMSERDCANSVEASAPKDDEFFCRQVVNRYGSVSFWYASICTQDSDCPDWQECAVRQGAPWGECQMACPDDECVDHADCPEGQMCYGDIACGDCSILSGICWDGMATFCMSTAPIF